MKTKDITLSEDECACIMVGLAEFDARIYEEKSGCFDAYKKINPKLIEKFRKICWEFHYDRIDKSQLSLN